MATAPRPGAGRRAEAENTSITIKVDGEAFTVRPSEVTAKMAGELRQQTKHSIRAVMEAAADDPDLDTIASLVWLARRQRGESVTWDEVADAISYDSDIDGSDEPDGDDEDGSPEA